MKTENCSNVTGDVILDMNAVFSQTIVSDNFQLDCINGQEVSGDRVTTTMFETSGHHLVAGEDFELDMCCDKDASDCRVQLAVSRSALLPVMRTLLGFCQSALAIKS